MRHHPAPLVLAINDVGLRTVLTARLGMAGEMPISTADHRDPTLDRALRASALLVIEAWLLRSAPQRWAPNLRAERWLGKIVIIIDDAPADLGLDDDIYLVGRRNADVSVLALLQLWRLQERQHPTPPG